MPPQLFDAHFHIIDPAFPLRPNQGYLPQPFTIDDYLSRAAPLGIVAGALVSGSFQGFDQDYLLAALKRLGANFVGVTQLPATVSDQRLLQLDGSRVRGVRFNLRRGGSAAVAELEVFANRLFDLLGWHVELYLGGAELPRLEQTIAGLPAVSIDHLGLSRAGLPALLRLVERGVRVKASGFGRVDLPLVDTLREIHAASPGALMFGSDLPSTRAPRPFRRQDVRLIEQALGEAGAARALSRNALDFYRLLPRAGSD